MNTTTKVKIIIIKFVWLLSRIFCIIPVDNNKIMFLSYDGGQYSDSPKYISDYYLVRNRNLKQVWGFDKDFDYFSNDISSAIICCRKGTIAFLYHLFTAKEIVINDFMSTAFRLRRNQVLLNTWHGGGTFKTIGMSRNETSDYDEFFYKAHARNTTAFSLSSEYFKETVVTRSFLFYGETINSGMPRNFILFKDGEAIRLRHKVLKHFNINESEDIKLILYAPTYRNYTQNKRLDKGFELLDIDKCRNAFLKRFKGKVILLNRSHHVMSGEQVIGDTINATKYPDMQELIIASDVLISDYSSCMWDFALTGKPIFVYAPDLSTYESKIDFFMPAQEWPFPLAYNNDELEKNICKFDSESYKIKLKKYMDPLRSYEGPDSVEKVCFWLDQHRK